MDRDRKRLLAVVANAWLGNDGPRIFFLVRSVGVVAKVEEVMAGRLVSVWMLVQFTQYG